MYNFKDGQKEWDALPVDDVGYIPTKELLSMTDEDFRNLVETASEHRYDLDGFRNYKNKWRNYLGLDDTSGKTILDFGCGIGLESKQLDLHNKVILADISPSSIAVAKRTVGKELDSCVISGEYPFFTCEPFDIFYANGVLHHTPHFREILLRATELMKPGGEIRLMLYTDRGWKLAGDNPVRYFDAVGNYADWYNREKIENIVGDFLDVFFCKYITNDDRYLVVKLKEKQK